jgi:hypothetical protein
VILLLIFIGIVQYFIILVSYYRKFCSDLDHFLKGVSNSGPAVVNQVKFQYVSSTQSGEGSSSPVTSQTSENEDLNDILANCSPKAPFFPFLESLMWLIIPFIPLSGVIFTLGTLLAERLLYLTSIGYCLLFSLISYAILSFVFSFLGSTPSNKQGNKETMNKKKSVNKFPLSVYFIWIIVVVSYYMKQTREYNLAWKSDDSLFFHALKVCPNSSKINLQVSKIHINHRNFTQAMYHVNKAKEIDPEFCDVQFTEALILLSLANDDSSRISSVASSNSFMTGGRESLALHHYEEKIMKAMNLCIQNLHCIYTNKQSYKMLHDLWGHQLANNENRIQYYQNSLVAFTQQEQQQQRQKAIAEDENSRLEQRKKFFQDELMKSYEEKIDLLELQSIAASENSLTFLAIQKYLENSLFCYEKLKFKKSFIYLKRSHDQLLNILQEYSLPEKPTSLQLLFSLPSSSFADFTTRGVSSAEQEFYSKMKEIRGNRVLAPSSMNPGLSPDLSMGNAMLNNIRFLQCRVAALNGTLRSTLYQYSKQSKEYVEFTSKFPRNAFSNDTIFSALKEATSGTCLTQFLNAFLHSEQQQQQLMVLLEHLKVANSHFITLFHQNFFPLDLMSTLQEIAKSTSSSANDQKKKKNMSKQLEIMEKNEFFLVEFLRQLSIGFSLEFLSGGINKQKNEMEEEWNKIYYQMNQTLVEMKSFSSSGSSSELMRALKQNNNNNQQKNALQNMVVYQIVLIWNSLANKYYFTEKNYLKSSNYYLILISYGLAIQQKKMDLYLLSLIPFATNTNGTTIKRITMTTGTNATAATNASSTLTPSNDTQTDLSKNLEFLSLHSMIWEKKEFQRLFSFRGFPSVTGSPKNKQLSSSEDHKNSFIIKSEVFCQWIYYYLDSYVGVEGFYSHSNSVMIVTKLLKFYGKCINYQQQQQPKRKEETNKNLLTDQETINQLTERFRTIYCKITDMEQQDAELCAYS